MATFNPDTGIAIFEPYTSQFKAKTVRLPVARAIGCPRCGKWVEFEFHTDGFEETGMGAERFRTIYLGRTVSFTATGGAMFIRSRQHGYYYSPSGLKHLVCAHGEYRGASAQAVYADLWRELCRAFGDTDLHPTRLRRAALGQVGGSGAEATPLPVWIGEEFGEALRCGRGFQSRVPEVRHPERVRGLPGVHEGIEWTPNGTREDVGYFVNVVTYAAATKLYGKGQVERSRLVSAPGDMWAPETLVRLLGGKARHRAPEIEVPAGLTVRPILLGVHAKPTRKAAEPVDVVATPEVALPLLVASTDAVATPQPKRARKPRRSASPTNFQQLTLF